MNVDLVVRDGVVLDGTGAAAVPADVAISAGRIASIGRVASRGSVEIDAAGGVVAPGFIDCHTHSDAVPFLDPEHDRLRLASVRQGVTTEICGNCGFSLFPATGASRTAVTTHLATLFRPEPVVYDDVDAFARACEAGSMATNRTSFVGHGTLRAVVVGFERRPASEGEVARMADLAAAAFAGGAAALSSGLGYPPGSYATTDEVVALAAVAARFARPYVTHVRDEADGVADAIAEALEIGRRSGAAVHISHLKAAGPGNHGRMPALVAMLDEAGAAGLDVGADAYPYTAVSTLLYVTLPSWVSDGGTEAMLRRLQDPSARARIVDDLESSRRQGSVLAGQDWSDVIVASAPRHVALEGKDVAAIAEDWGIGPVEAVARLLIEERGAVTIVLESASPQDLRDALAWDRCAIGSDGIPIPGKPHPRWAGSFARVLGRVVREQRLLPLAEAVRRMTSLPASRFGLEGRGRLVPGAVGDVVVFDPDVVADRATYDDPLLPPVGVHSVLVNGQPVIMDGADTGARPGVFVRVGAT